MRILVLSDSHGKTRNFIKAVKQHRDAEKIFFLGDGLRDYEEACRQFPDRIFYAVRGNCDFCSRLPDVDTAPTRYGNIFYTHGDRFFVKGGYQHLLSAGRQTGARLLLFGHTHCPLARYEDGIYLFNPGSLAQGSYGLCDLLESGISMNHLSI